VSAAGRATAPAPERVVSKRDGLDHAVPPLQLGRSRTNGYPLRLEAHREIPSDPILRSGWNALVRRIDRPELFFTWEWARAVEHAYSHTLRPLLFVGYDENREIVGVVALALDEANRVTFLTANTGDYCDFLSEPDRRAEFVSLVLRELRKLEITDLSLANLPADSATVSCLSDCALKNNFHNFVRPAYDCARVVLGSTGEREQLKLSLGRKKLFRRALNAFAREGPVAVSHLIKWQDVEPMLPAFYSAHVGRFLGSQRISNIASSARRKFLHKLAFLLCETGWFRLSRLTVGERAIAWNYGFRFEGSWFWYQPTFDERLEQHSPGWCLLMNLILEACDSPELQVVDLGLGAENYKERLANSVLPLVHARLSLSSSRVAREFARYHLARTVKRTPTLENAVRQGLDRMAALSKQWKNDGPSIVAKALMQRATSIVSSRQRIQFYEWAEDAADTKLDESLTLLPLDREALSQAAMIYEADPETVNYLLRSARRLNSQSAQGFVLLSSEGAPLHLCWIAPFDGFMLSGVDERLVAPAATADLIFDCWTPAAVRGRGYFAEGLARVARHLTDSGRVPWIFASTSSECQVRDINTTAFQLRYSVVYTKMLAIRSRSTILATAGSDANLPPLRSRV
jgi:CelD/BcsL family acetyltransferase involved in cellulose biosynthesis